MKKALFVLVPSIAMGGAELLACFQTLKLANDYTVHLVILDRIVDKRPLNEFGLIASEVQVHELKSGFSTLTGKGIVKAFFCLPKLISLIKKHEPVTIIAHLPPSHFIARVVTSLSSTAVKVTQYHHGLEFEESPLDSTGKLFFNSINKYLSERTNESHLFISNAVKEHYEKNFKKPSTDGLVIYNAVPDENISLNSAQEFLSSKGVPRKKNVWVLPGRVQAVKGQLFFLPVFDEFCKYVAASDFQLIIAGGGPDEQLVQKRINELRLEDKVFLTGTLSRPLLLSFIKIADLVVIPSLVEGLGNVAVESLMLGKQTLTSDAGGLTEVIVDKQNGYLFKKGDSIDCIKQLIAIYERCASGQCINFSDIRKSYEYRFLPSHHVTVLKEYLRKCAE